MSRCNQTADGCIWGGCGSTDNPSFAINPKDSKMCAQTFSTQFARYDDGLGTGGEDSQPNSNKGCLLCGPKICPPDDIDGSTCIGDTLCGFSGITKNDKSSQGALNFCIDQVNKINPNIRFSPYQASGLKDRSRDTSGMPVLVPKSITITPCNQIRIDFNSKIYQNVNGDVTLSFYEDSPFIKISDAYYGYGNSWYIDTKQLYINAKWSTITLNMAVSSSGTYHPIMDTPGIPTSCVDENGKNPITSHCKWW